MDHSLLRITSRTNMGKLLTTILCLIVWINSVSSAKSGETSGAKSSGSGSSSSSSAGGGSGGGNGGLQEFCQWETFNASCSDGEVILVETARYGRMSLGRCLNTDYYIGCSADVLSHVDGRCSGKQRCSIEIPDPDLFNVQPCRKDLVAYFEASYTCVKVAGYEQGGDATCKGAISLPRPKGHILSSTTHHTDGLGSSKCPWLITAQPGQTINITLLDFATWSPYQSPRSGGSSIANDDDRAFATGGGGAGTGASTCPIYAVFKEATAVEYLRVCGNRRRVKHVYTSGSHQIEIHIVNMQEKDTGSSFMLYYEAIGCPDPDPVVHASVKRDGDTLKVTCNHTNEKWHLVCKGTQWIGDIRNCTPGKQLHMEEQISTGEHFPFGLLIAIAIGVLIGVLCGFVFLMLAFICRRRQRMRGRPPRDTGALLLDHLPPDDAKNMYKLVEVRHALPPNTSTQCPGCYGDTGDYSHYPPHGDPSLNNHSSKVGVCEPIQMYDPHQYETRYGGSGGGGANKGISTGQMNGNNTGNADRGEGMRNQDNQDNQPANALENNHNNSIVEQEQQLQLQRQIQNQPIPPVENDGAGGEHVVDHLPGDGNNPLPPGAVICECANCHSCSTIESPYTMDNWKPQDVYRSVRRLQQQQQQQQSTGAGSGAEPPDVTQHDSGSTGSLHGGGGGGGGGPGSSSVALVPANKTYGTMKGRNVGGVEYRQIPSVSLNAELRYFSK